MGQCRSAADRGVLRPAAQIRGPAFAPPSSLEYQNGQLQTLRGKLRRLTACHNPLHRLGREKRQTYKPADVLLANSVALGDLDHRSATHEIVEPAVCSRHRSEQRLIGFARRSRPAVDYESKLNPWPPELHGYMTLDRKMTRTIWCSAFGIREREFDRKPRAILAKVDPVDQR